MAFPIPLPGFTDRFVGRKATVIGLSGSIPGPPSGGAEDVAAPLPTLFSNPPMGRRGTVTLGNPEVAGSSPAPNQG